MIKQKIKQYLITFFILIIIDVIWIFGISQDFYQEMLSGFSRPEIVPVWSAILVWLLIPLGIVLFVHPLAQTKKQSLLYGGAFGLILYGVYDFTNFATLANWNILMVIVDVIWGTFLCGVGSLLLHIIDRKYLRK